ncbi:hypothetical protein GM661_05670 [Iocasia frigidifontis]|uniref:Threonine/serine exporter-like N-terminal domain-containing protein n=1 Tax=Iocasia fonsfrigidae TaxID=2682810 RepID=A0A8A7K714_9FIRM|nr:threonine/serine exporter family protein [Iocasia fonsfrigidae]QTL97506.1 hypothetical protein GM661_05670 [Iocasia fonsfrigidae]
MISVKNKKIQFALKVGEILLKNGAETNRVERIVKDILIAKNVAEVEVFATPTVIMLNVREGELDDTITLIRRIYDRGIRLDKVALVWKLALLFIAGDQSDDQFFDELVEIINLAPYIFLVRILATGLMSAFFTIMFQGNQTDFWVAAVVGGMLGVIDYGFRQLPLSDFIIKLLDSSLITVVTLLLSMEVTTLHIDKVIFAAIMPLVPGVAITNAVLDIIRGDLLAGLSRGIEAVFVAVSIATGVGITLKLGALLGVVYL